MSNFTQYHSSESLIFSFFLILLFQDFFTGICVIGVPLNCCSELCLVNHSASLHTILPLVYILFSHFIRTQERVVNMISARDNREGL